MKALKIVLMVLGGVMIVLVLLFVFIPTGDDDAATKTQPNAVAAVDSTQANTQSEQKAEAATNANADGTVHHIGAEEFQQLVADYTSNKDAYIGDGPCVVDFFATWCGPCKALSPVIEQMAQKYAGKVAFYKVDIDQASAVSNAYGIESIPTLFFCNQGSIERITGAPSEEDLEKAIQSML